MQQRVLQKLEAHGVSGAAKEWVVKALDPACECVSGGLPDSSAFSVLRPEYRVTQVVSFAQPGIGPTFNNWDLMVWATPGDVNGVYWATMPSGTGNFFDVTPPPSATTGYIQLQAPVDLPGAFAMASLDPAFVTTAGSVRVASNLPYAFRHQYKGLTAELVAPAVADQGSVYAAQFQAIHGTSVLSDTTIINMNTGARNFAKNAEIRLPMDEDSLTRMSVGFYEGEARDGCYLPLRLCGPSQPFVSTCSTIPTQIALYGVAPLNGMFQPIQDVSSIPFPTMVVVNNNTWSGKGAHFGAAPIGVPWINSASMSCTGSVSGIQGWDTGLDNMNVGVVIFRGLAAAVGGGFGASVRLTVRSGLEVVPSPQSPDRIFAEPAAPYHPRALEAYYSIALELKDAYPASYNSLGSIFDVIEKVASVLWKPIRAVGEAAEAAFGGLGGRRLPATPQPARDASHARMLALGRKPKPKGGTLAGVRTIANTKRARRKKVLAGK